MKTIMHTVDFDAERERVWKAITAEEDLAGWWTTQVTAETDVGGHVQFTFVEGFNPRMVIVEADAPNGLVWRCVAGVDDWADNTFSFELVDHERGCRLRFRQHYATELDDDTYGTFNFNWGYYLESLRLLCTTGTGKPFEPPT